MSSFAGKVLGSAVGSLPPAVIRRAARQYLAGAGVADAMREAHDFAARGMTSTIAVVGEAAESEAYARQQVAELASVLRAVDDSHLDVRLGVKLTALGLIFDPSVARRNLVEIAQAADAAVQIIEVDMEQARFVSETLATVRSARKDLPNVHAVVQAELRRTRDDVRSLVSARIPTRIVKGTYKEGPRWSYQLPEVVRANFVELAREYLAGGVQVAIATHDEYVIYSVLHLADQLGVDRSMFEFQMIMGVAHGLRAALVEDGYPVRVTINFGADAHKWSVRRLKENPEMMRYVAASLRDAAINGLKKSDKGLA